jgi:hypothetical protein
MTVTPTDTASKTATPTETYTFTLTATPTATYSLSFTSTPTFTVTPTHTNTYTNTYTYTATLTHTNTPGTTPTTCSAAVPGFVQGSVVTNACASANASFSYTVPSETNGLLLVQIESGSGGPTVSGVTWNGTALSQITGSPLAISGGGDIYTYYLANPAAGTYSLAFSVTAGCSWNVAAMVYNNVNTSSPFGTITSNSGSAATFTDNITTTGTNSIIDDFLAYPNGAFTFTGLNGTQLFASSASGCCDDVYGSYLGTTTAGAYSLSYTQANGADAWTAETIEIKAGTAACGTPTLTPDVTNTPVATATSSGPTTTPTPLSAGASVPYTEYEAEAASYTGTLIGPSTQMWMNGGSLNTEIAAESSGREAVELSSTGQYVKFTTTKQCNSIVVRYIIPDSSGGGGISATLSCYVNGTLNQELNMTSQYSWDYGSNLNYTTSSGVNVPGYNESPGGDAFHLYDETHALLGTEVAAGSTIELIKESSDTAAYYVIDFIDLEDVPAAATMPSGFVSIVSSGAVSGGTTDCTSAIQNCVNANTKVWIPTGNFGCLSGSINVPSGHTIEGAGMWYSELSGYYATFNLAGSNTVFSNFLLSGGTTNRDDNSSDSGFNNGGGTGSSITNVWVEHEKCGYWMNNAGATSNGFVITGCRFRDTYADGVNINEGSSNCTITQCNFRNTGDDSIASWSQSGYASNTNNTFSYNTVQCPWRADGIALYGGSSNIVNNNLVTDTLNQSGIMIEQGFSSTTFGGTSTFTGNVLERCGGQYGGSDYGAIDLWGNQSGLAGGFTFTNTTISNSVYSGVEFNGPNDASGGTFTNIVITSPATYGVQVMSGASGTATFNSPCSDTGGTGYTNGGSMSITFNGCSNL